MKKEKKNENIEKNKKSITTSHKKREKIKNMKMKNKIQFFFHKNADISLRSAQK